MMRWSLTLCAAVAVRIALAEVGAADALAGWTYVESAPHSLDGVKEAHALRSLGHSPYAGSLVHAPPTLIFALGPVVGLRPGLRVLPFALVDVVASLGVGRLVVLLGNKSSRGATGKDTADQSHRSISPHACILLYLFNPYTLAACIGNNWSSLEACSVVIAIWAASHRFAWTSTVAWALAVHMSLHQVYMVVPLAVLLLSGVHQRMAATASLLAVKSAVSLAVVHGTASFLAVLLGSSALESLSSTYGFILKAEDLTPNMGLWWYFFAEIFEHFRPFFLFVFHVQPALLLLPLTMRIRHKPASLLLATALLITLFKPYPCAMDLGLCVSLVPLALCELHHLPSLFVVGCALMMAAGMHPVLLHLWVERYTGNANFVLATTIVHALAITTLAVDVASVATSGAPAKD